MSRQNQHQHPFNNPSGSSSGNGGPSNHTNNMPPFPQLSHIKLETSPSRRSYPSVSASGDNTPNMGYPPSSSSSSGLIGAGAGVNLPRIPGMVSAHQGHPIHPGIPHHLFHPSNIHSNLHDSGSIGGGPGSSAASPEDEEDEIQDDTVVPGVGGSDREGTAGTGGASGSAKKRRPHATRRRVVQSCSECRRRKIKCDKQFPCGPCILRNDQLKCHEVGMAEKNLVQQAPSTAVTTADLALIAQRLDALEAALVKSGALLPSDLDQFLKVIRPTASGLESNIDNIEARRLMSKNDAERGLPPTGRGGGGRGGAGTMGGDDDPVDETEGAALTLEHLAFGRARVDGSHSIPHFGPRGSSSVAKHAPNNDYHLARTSISGVIGGVTSSPGSAVGNNSPLEGRKVSVQGGPGTNASGSGSGSGGGTMGDKGNSGGGIERKGSKGLGFSDPLSAEERDSKIDALLDLIGPTDVYDLFYRRTDIASRSLTRALPSKERGELLVKAYLEKVDWLHRCLHIPTFLRQLNDLWALPKEQVLNEIAMPFVALYFTTLTLGLTFMDSAEAAKHFTEEEIRTLPDLYFKSGRSALWAADFMANASTESLQCLILIGIYMNNRDRGEAAWALLGAGIKMAQGLGLNRLGAEHQSTDGKLLPMWTGRWESLIQREVGRRIWWNLVFLDWAFAPSYNFSCSVQPDQIKTALPANIEDEDLIDDQPLKPKPMHIRTSMSFTLARLKFAEFSYRQIWQANNEHHPPYSFILSVDAELRKTMMDVPAFFQPDGNVSGDRDLGSSSLNSNDPKAMVEHYEKTMLNLAIHSRMLRLHRPWLSRGYEDERFAYSKEQCIRAARASLRMMSDSSGTAQFLEKWYMPLFYVSVSGMVVIIDLLRTKRKDMHTLETEQKINEVKGALDQMRAIADVSHSSRAAVKVMDFLMLEVEERRRPPGSALGKRKAGSHSPDEDDGLQRAVKKLIRQAQLEADSPTQSISAGTPTSNTRPMTSSPFQEAKDMPVFDAYPLPSSSGPAAPAFAFEPPTNTTSEISASRGGPSTSTGTQQTLGVPTMQYQALSPFSFPFDPTGSTSFNAGAVMPLQTPQPQLDPAVESMLASYFPQSMTNMNQSGSSSFGGGAFGGTGNLVNPGINNNYNSNNNGNNNNNLGATGGGNMGQNPDDFLSRVFGFSWDATPAGAQAAVNNLNNSGNGGNGRMSDGSGGQGGIQGYTAPLPFEGWTSGGWMA